VRQTDAIVEIMLERRGPLRVRRRIGEIITLGLK
jgi:hypothetical protein